MTDERSDAWLHQAVQYERISPAFAKEVADALAANAATIAAQAAEIERLKGERQMSAGFDPASDNGDESAVILMCFNCAYAGPRGEDDEGNVCCPECGARAMEASNG